MTDTANYSIQHQRIFRRAFASVAAWLQAMDYTGFDYALDRVKQLEREVEQLKAELNRISRKAGHI